jgi:hypothetical protein
MVSEGESRTGEVVPRPTVFIEADRLFEDGVLQDDEGLHCFVVGLFSAQGNAAINLWRHEVLPVTRDILTSEVALSRLQAAVQQSEEIGKILRDAVYYMAQCLLKPDNPSSAEADAAKNLAHSLQGEQQYWSALDSIFHRLLRDIGQDERAVERWRSGVVQAAEDAFGRVAVALGNGGKELRARVEAGYRMNRKLARFRNKVTKGKMNEQSG